MITFQLETLLKLGFSHQQLRLLAQNRIELLADNYSEAQELLSRGITTLELGIIDLDLLEKYFNASYRIDTILKFITLKQMFGLDRTPLALNSVVIPECYITIEQLSAEKFAEFLNARGCPLSEYKKLPGMTQGKLELLCEGFPFMTEIMGKGIEIKDFARVDEQRLKHVITHYAQAEKALEFVDISELLGIHDISQQKGPGFFNRKYSAKINASINDTNNCIIM